MTQNFLFPGFMERKGRKRIPKVDVSLKVGSVLRVPVLDGWSATSADPSTISVQVANKVATITGVKVGRSWVTLTMAADLKVNLDVAVVAS